MHDSELLSFIDSIYREPYSLIKNNCIHKSLKIQRKARERGKAADLITCVSLVKMKWLRGLRVPSAHVYALVDGEKVDVSLDPGHEARYCRNAEKKFLFPVNISGIGRRIRRKADEKAPER